MSRTGTNGPKKARLNAWLGASEGDEEEQTRGLRLPDMPMIPEAYLDRRGVVHLKRGRGESLDRQYEGPIEVGMVFAWEPDLPWARELIVVCEIVEPDDDERRIWTMPIDSPMRGKRTRWEAAMRHVAPYLFAGAPVWNDEGRFREAAVPTIFNPQTP